MRRNYISPEMTVKIFSDVITADANTTSAVVLAADFLTKMKNDTGQDVKIKEVLTMK